MPHGALGEFATVVGKARGSDDWYLGSLTDERPRSLQLTLDFLQPGRTYRAEINRDGANAGLDGAARFDFVREERSVRHRDRLDLQLAASGSQAIRLVALPD